MQKFLYSLLNLEHIIHQIKLGDIYEIRKAYVEQKNYPQEL